MSTGFSSAAIPNSPTIGTATATSDVAATVAYTAAVLGANGVTFTATSSPSSITGTGSSPITVTGLTASTAYTFTVTAGNANGTSAASSASNSITTSAPPSSYESIATVTVGSTTSSITFNSIPATYTHLQVRGVLRNTRTSDRSGSPAMRFNADSGSNYSYHRVYGDGATAGTDVGVSQTQMYAIGMATNLNTESIFGVAIWDILDYANTNKYKTVRVLAGMDNNRTTDVGSVGFSSGAWRNTNAITSITIFPNINDWSVGSTFALYGIKGA
jgi:hypothetical protein